MDIKVNTSIENGEFVLSLTFTEVKPLNGQLVSEMKIRLSKENAYLLRYRLDDFLSLGSGNKI